jgi:glycosyltransferase involved in cell wall biosynthesis
MEKRKITKDDRVSFVMPAFNSAGTIVESIESIMDGNFEDGDEMIVVNDGSTDNTVEVVENLRKKYPVIKLISYSDNRGCPAARNVGYTATRHPIIFNLYSDDLLVPGSVKLLKDYMISENADMAGFGAGHYFQKDKRKVTHKWVFIPGVLSFADFLAGDINPGPGGDYMFTKELWERVGGVWEYGKGLHEAWGFTLKCLAAGAKVVVMPNSFYHHRYGHNSLFARESKKENEISLMATKMITPYLDRLNEEDAAYIKSEEGSKNWYNTTAHAPIRLKGQPAGKTGVIVVPPKEKIKRVFVRLIRKSPWLLNLVIKKNGR